MGDNRGNRMEGDQCEACRYWVGLDQDERGVGRCRRHAPRPALRIEPSHGMKYCDWPLTDAHDWCGEYQPQDEPKTPMKMY